MLTAAAVALASTETEAVVVAVAAAAVQAGLMQTRFTPFLSNFRHLLRRHLPVKSRLSALKKQPRIRRRYSNCRRPRPAPVVASPALAPAALQATNLSL